MDALAESHRQDPVAAAKHVWLQSDQNNGRDELDTRTLISPTLRGAKLAALS